VAARLRQSEEPRLLTVDEAAAYIRRTPKVLRHIIASGSIPAVREESRVHLDRADLDRWIEMRKVRGVNMCSNLVGAPARNARILSSDRGGRSYL
jgi:excisionase family DNA binding protein